ncbi:MAG TPA: hypothetical protein VJ302_15455, partial [Blastocatellia bacterium]|nr:hypothetical protein [Blastocatellia bacterium]
MATSLFKVKVLSKREAVLVLRLRIISAEQPDFCRSKSFALMLLLDPIIYRMVEDAPLAQQVSSENILDVNWVSQHLDEYIKECRLS